MADEIIPKEEIAVEAPIEPFNMPVSEPVQVPEPQTAQIPVNEPLSTSTKTPSEPETELIIKTIQEETKIVEPEIKPEPKQESKPSEQILEIKPEPISESKSEPKPIPEVIPAVTIIPKSKILARKLLKPEK